MSLYQYRARRFHALMGQHDPETPVSNLSADERRLRARIFGEEAAELLVALVGSAEAIDVAITAIGKTSGKRGERGVFGPGDLPEIADACFDTSFVAAGILSICGVDDEPIILAGCDANDAKVGGGKDENGKFKKPADWVAPDIEGLLTAQGWAKP